MARIYSTTIEKEKHIKEISDDERNKIHKVMNEYVSTHHKLNLNIVKKRLFRVFGKSPDISVVEDICSQIYVYMYLNNDTTLGFYETDNMQKLFNILAFNINTTYNAKQLIERQEHTEFIDDILEDFVDEENDIYTVEDLDWNLSNEERLEYHQMALDELKTYLFENPQSYIAKALEIQKKKGNNAYNVALHFAATPSYKFIRDNRKVLGIVNVQDHVDDFKKTLSKVTGKTLVKHSQSKCKL